VYPPGFFEYFAQINMKISAEKNRIELGAMEMSGKPARLCPSRARAGQGALAREFLASSGYSTRILRWMPNFGISDNLIPEPMTNVIS